MFTIYEAYEVRQDIPPPLRASLSLGHTWVQAGPWDAPDPSGKLGAALNGIWRSQFQVGDCKALG